DDFHDIGAEISLEQCLSEMRQAGYAGTEMGRKFPRDPAKLAPILEEHGLKLASAWHSTHLLSGSFEEQQRAFESHLDFLEAMGSQVAIIAECTAGTYMKRDRVLEF